MNKNHICAKDGNGRLFCLSCKKTVPNKGIHQQTTQISISYSIERNANPIRKMGKEVEGNYSNPVEEFTGE